MKRNLIGLAAALFALFALAIPVANGLSHAFDPGSDESAPSHPNNPGHLWISVWTDHVGTITSGGRFHDGCSTLKQTAGSPDWFVNDTNADGRLDYCRGPLGFAEDFSMDIGGSGTSRVKVDYAGYDAGANPAVKNNTPIYLQLYVSSKGNFSGSNPACVWTRYLVQATYTNTNNVTGTYPIGYVNLAHVTTTHSVGTTITWTHSRANGNGTGTVHYVDVAAGSVYNGSDGAGGAICSTAAHSHLGLYSSHSWGAQYEWHGQGPDFYYGLHVHGPSVFPSAYNSPPDGDYGLLTPVDSPGSTQIMGFLGGGRAGYTQWLNPLYAPDH